MYCDFYIAPLSSHDISGGTGVSEYQNLFNEFQLPQQDAKKLSFCGAKPRQVQTWLNELAIVDNKQISILFYKLLPEVNHLDISAGQRLGLMSLLRPQVHHCIDTLAKDFLKQPLSMNENMNKIAAIAQALQRHLCDGYLLTIRQFLQEEKRSTANTEALSLAIYYAVHGLSQLLYRSYQLYVPRPPLLWKKLHQLFELTQRHQLENKIIPDNLLNKRTGLSIKQAYMRALILDCSHCNQLRQIDIEYLYHLLEEWSPMVNLVPARQGADFLYWIDLAANSGPLYQSRYPQSQNQGTPSDSLVALNLQALQSLLANHATTTHDNNIVEIPIHVRQSLLSHLNTCWNRELQRIHPRTQSNIELEVCVGLKAAHQQLLGNSSFNEFLQKHGCSDTQDTMNGLVGFNANQAHGLTSNQSTDRYSANELAQDFIPAVATDVSEQGYCLRWDQLVPPQIKAGEIILLREKGTLCWQAGAIRWTQRLNRHSYVGVQLLEGKAFASAASTTLDDGMATPFFRTVLLKDEERSDISSIITPIIPFAPQQQIQLQTDENCQKVRLHHLILSSGSISQYRYQTLQG